MPKNQDVIEVVESLLERAKSGEIIGIAYSITREDRSVNDGWARSDDASHFSLIVGLDLLKHRMVSEVIDEPVRECEELPPSGKQLN
jgi:hypothetical protein